MNEQPASSPNQKAIRTGWASGLAKVSLAVLLFEAISGLMIRFGPFGAVNQWAVLGHTAVGALTLAPLAWYCIVHWQDYRHYSLSHVVLLGYVGVVVLLVCSVSGLVLTWQGLFGTRTGAWLRQTHLISTFVTLGAILPHLWFSWDRARRAGNAKAAPAYLGQTLGAMAVGLAVMVAPAFVDRGAQYVNEFPKNYNFVYGKDRPFAPSLARTDTNRAFDSRSLAGSASCGTAGCHEQIYKEWQPSAHRYAAMDPGFQAVQNIMAKQNGPESTRYCGGCHDPISLFSGTKNLFVENLTSLQGYQEGISCLACHSVRSTDIRGNANYIVSQPHEYLWQWQTTGAGKLARDFLIRTYPAEHSKLSKRAFKKPEYCAACHKQFIDQEINRVGWVQLQNQYDNWAASHWNHKGDPSKTVECRECHMPLVDSHDPAAGDPADYNRSASDGKHRSHRFLGANQMMPALLKLEGSEQHTQLITAWLQGKIEVPEIRGKWAAGPIVKLAISAPTTVAPGADFPVRVVMASNKVGHDYPTGPLDIIQSWLEIHVTDDTGHEIYSSGKRDTKNFIEPGTFLFKAEAVDQRGNVIDRHNLWEMVGVRYRRALFPGYSDTATFSVPCSATVVKQEPSATPGQREENVRVPAPAKSGSYTIVVSLLYRKVDQFMLNYLFGEDKLTAPITEIGRATATVRVQEDHAALPRSTQPVNAAKL